MKKIRLVADAVSFINAIGVFIGGIVLSNVGLGIAGAILVADTAYHLSTDVKNL